MKKMYTIEIFDDDTFESVWERILVLKRRDQIIDYVKELFSDVEPEILFLFGTPVAFYLVNKIDELLKKESV